MIRLWCAFVRFGFGVRLCVLARPPWASVHLSRNIFGCLHVLAQTWFVPADCQTTANDAFARLVLRCGFWFLGILR